ncbi:transposase family protein [Micromonosporaceae bacterium Da 78-11]
MSSVVREEAPFTRSCHSLLELLLAVCDGRSGQGRDHPVAVVLAPVAAATVAGLKGYTAISGWVTDVPTEILDSLYTRVEARPGGWPSRSTLWRVCTDTDGDVLDAVIAEWTAAQRPGTGEQACTSSDTPSQVRLDGKTVRGAVDPDGEQLHHCLPWPARPARTRPPSSSPRHRPTAPRPANQKPPAPYWKPSTYAT